MELLIGFFALIGAFVSGFVGHLVAHDFVEFAPRLTRSLIERAALKLPKALRERYCEEWLSHSAELTTLSERTAHIFGCFISAYKIRNRRQPFKTLRIDFGKEGSVELDYVTAMFLFAMFKGQVPKTRVGFVFNSAE